MAVQELNTYQDVDPELGMVNRCLSYVGLQPVSFVDIDDPDVASTLVAIQQASYDIQCLGWWFNTESISVQVDAQDNHIPLPPNIATVLTAGYTIRNFKLYDMTKGTDIFSKGTKIKLDVIIILNVKDLPLSARQAVVTKAITYYSIAEESDRGKSEQAIKTETASMLTLQREHTANSKYNIFRGVYASQFSSTPEYRK